MKGRPSCFLFEMVLLFTFCFCRSVFLPFPLRYFTPPSHLHNGLPFGTPFPCLQTEQVGVVWNLFRDCCMLFLAQIWFIQGRPSCCHVDLCLTFLSFFFHPFHNVDLHIPKTSLHIGCHSELYDPCLQTEQVRVGWMPFRDSCLRCRLRVGSI